MSYTDGYMAGEIRSEREAREKFTEVELWLRKIEQAKTCKKRESWMKDARNSVSMYEAGELTLSDEMQAQLSGANIWHSNIETIVPALYNSKPLPDVRVRYGDADKVQKMVCDIIERGLNYDLDSYDYDNEVKEIVKQAELTGWGIPRIRYFPKVVNVTTDDTADGDTTGAGYERLVHDDVKLECHPWDRFIVSPARSIERISWIAFEWDMTLDEIDDLVPAKQDEETGEMIRASDRLSPDKSSRDDDGSRKDTDPAPDNPGILNTITVYEIWDKRSKKVIFITPKDKKFPLRDEPDPLELTGFFPVPKILYAKRRTSSVQPISPWTVYKGLFQEFEDITQRINGLVSQIRVRGLYAKELEADFELLRDCKDGEYVPAKDVSMFTAGGGKGLEAAIAHWPLQQLMAALKEAVEHRERVKQLIFETTGLSDILRGATNPNETLGAQKIKASWGSQRVQDMQEDIAELNRAIIRMKAEIRQRFTDWELVKEMTGMRFDPQLPEQPDPAQMGANGTIGGDGGAQSDLQTQYLQAQQQYQQQVAAAQQQAQQLEAAVQSAYKSRSSMLRVDIETDSTIRADMSRDQEQMNLFVQATGTFVQAIAGLVQIMPETRQPMFKLYAAQASKFKLGRQGEAALEELVAAAGQPPAPQGPPQPDPAAMQQQAEMQDQMADKQHGRDMEKLQGQAQVQQTRNEGIDIKAQAEMHKSSNDARIAELSSVPAQSPFPPVNGEIGAMQ